MTGWIVELVGEVEDQSRWREFCESFMSPDIWLSYNERGETVCYITVDPDQPIDSTRSMPSFIQQATNHGLVTRSRRVTHDDRPPS